MPPTNPMVTAATADLTDDELVSRIASGDVDAFGLFWNRHHALVFQWCLRKLRDRSAAEDVLQETMYAFWKHVDSGNPVIRPGGLIMTIARRRCVDAIRRKGRHGEFRDADSEFGSTGLVISELTDSLQLLDRLHTRIAIVLDAMGGVDQVIGYHYFLLDPRPTLKEIGAIVGLVAGNVQRRIKGIRLRLKEELDDFG